MLLAAATVTAGCACSAADGPQTGCIQADMTAAMKASRDVLLGMGFQVDKYDVEAGIIRTRPLSGGQFFELWRGDNADSCGIAESSIHSIMRTAEMTFAQGSGNVCIVCEVDVKRLSLPEKPITGTSAAYAMFTRSSSQLMTTRLDTDRTGQVTWLDAGSDGGVARKILEAVGARLNGRGSPK